MSEKNQAGPTEGGLGTPPVGKEKTTIYKALVEVGTEQSGSLTGDSGMHQKEGGLVM